MPIARLWPLAGALLGQDAEPSCSCNYDLSELLDFRPEAQGWIRLAIRDESVRRAPNRAGAEHARHQETPEVE
jgi:hypothetical protein